MFVVVRGTNKMKEENRRENMFIRLLI